MPMENSLLFAAALRANKVPFELHIYEKGVHGLALCDELTANRPERLAPDNAGWVDLAVRWIRRNRRLRRTAGKVKAYPRGASLRIRGNRRLTARIIKSCSQTVHLGISDIL